MKWNRSFAFLRPWSRTEALTFWDHEAEAEAEALAKSRSLSRSFDFLKSWSWSRSFGLKSFGFVNPKRSWSSFVPMSDTHWFQWKKIKKPEILAELPLMQSTQAIVFVISTNHLAITRGDVACCLKQTRVRSPESRSRSEVEAFTESRSWSRSCESTKLKPKLLRFLKHKAKGQMLSNY